MSTLPSSGVLDVPLPPCDSGTIDTTSPSCLATAFGTLQQATMKNNLSANGESNRDMKESQRALELRKFFAPHHNSAENDFNATLNNDGALNAYAETVVWRLKAVHAMVSRSDRIGTQYFLAGAIRTNVAHDPDDVITTSEWFGCSTVPTPGGLCEACIAIIPIDHSEDEYPCFVVNDLSRDERFASLPVVDGTIVSYRFYAGTPITTDHGINIGSFFFFDDKPRDGLTREQKRFLHQQARNVMRHFETKREAAERRRVALMSKGISTFLERTSQHTANEDSIDPHEDGAHVDEQSQDTHGITPELTAAEPNDTSAIAKETVLDKIRYALDQAAEILRDSLELNVGGVVFLDTAVGYTDTGNTDAYLDNTTNIGSQVEIEKSEDKRRQASNESNSGPVLSVDDYHSRQVSQESTRSHGDQHKAAKVLAMSAAKIAPWDSDANVLDAKTLQALINTYPKGNVWYTDEEGYFTSLDQLNGLQETTSSSPPGRRKSVHSVDLAHSRAEATVLSRVFQGARQIVFLPLWDAGGDRWYAGCFVWSRSPVPVFTVDSEVAYLSAFTNSVMVEISRLDAITSNKMKSDFISSISHEFRSPLHGILASAELLRESKLDASQREFIATIQNCSGTLLDTINHVLDYSKINSFEKNQKGTISNELIQTTNLALLCEDIISGMISASEFHGIIADDPSSAISREFRPGLASQDQPSRRATLDIILDIEQRDWYYNIQAGALRRVVMNIFGNAQKYTETGYIMVQMQIQEEARSHPNASTGNVLNLRIRDSGRGMSTEYMERKLYHPFAQEDSFAPGVGLGLSIVWSIVNQLGGQINIRSQIGKGTDVEISIPVEKVAEPDFQKIEADNTKNMLLEAQTCITKLQARAAATSVCFSRTQANNSRTKDINWTCIERYCSEWFGFAISKDPVDMIITDHHNESGYEAGQRVLVVHDDMLCPGKHVGEYQGYAVGHISPPVGPFRLARCLLALMEQDISPPPSEASFNLHLADRATQTPLGSPEERTIMDGIILTDYGFTPQTTFSNTPVSIDEEKVDEKNEPIITQHPETDSLPASISQLTLSPATTKSAIPFSPHTNSPIIPSTLFGILTLPTPKKSPPTPTSKSLNILAVDDNALNLQLLHRYLLKRKSDTIVTARDGVEAVAAVKDAKEKGVRFDVVFMDISMPNMNGFEATRAIRGLERRRGNGSEGGSEIGEDESGENGAVGNGDRALIVALTGLASKRDRSEAEESGFDDFLTKPISFGRIGELLRGLSEGK
ncbi:uncharacterized protein LY89DRAFT_622845 [Mollisia scopiformis]|uniref:Uncharacterized protein n=1 Tax=Mollisia scopiformis TaxID=149040 RepID=A0A194WXY3_MOLSC|nr:uncharacterized protein LY89DRAFT_622845 [Mollisia scopiformis]KUJ12833.1 hypothetical protein LY89DRAFT_622845 [Mollisia scopiformis]